jgi:hypothetical protein
MIRLQKKVKVNHEHKWVVKEFMILDYCVYCEGCKVLLESGLKEEEAIKKANKLNKKRRIEMTEHEKRFPNRDIQCVNVIGETTFYRVGMDGVDRIDMVFDSNDSNYWIQVYANGSLMVLIPAIHCIIDFCKVGE